MSDIKLYSLSSGVAELPASSVPLERELQTLIEQNMPAFFKVTFLKSEYAVTNGRIDSLGLDENNCPVIFEYKRSLNENVINQGLFYLDWLLDHKADFKLLVMERLGNEKADGIDWSFPCVMCIAGDFTKYDEHAVNQMQRNIKLIKYKKFGSDMILFEYLNSPTVQPLPDAADNQPTPVRTGSDKTFRQHYEEAPSVLRDLYDSVRSYILSLGDDIVENQLKLYVAFKKINNFICAEVYQSKILLHLRLKPETVELKNGLIRDVRNIGHFGTGDLEITVKSAEDFEKFKKLLDRAYNEN